MDCFDELVPGVLSIKSRTDFHFPEILSENEINLSICDAVPTQSLGYYKVNDVVFCGRAYAIRGDQVCYSASTIPKYWRKMLETNSNLLPERSQLIEREITRPAALFVSRDYNKYGHWWLDIVPRLYPLWRYRPELLKELAIVIPDDLTALGRDTLSVLYGINPAAFVMYDPDRESLRCRTAIIPTMPHTHYNFHPFAGDFYCHVIETCTSQRVAKGRRRRLLYLTRRNFAQRSHSKVRLLSNASEAEALAVSLGFELVSPEELTWRKQVELFAQARVVVGEHGSAMKNLLFAPCNTIAVVINYLNHTQSTIAALKGQRCIIIETDGFNDNNHNDPYTVDLEKLETCIKHALQAVCGQT